MSKAVIEEKVEEGASSERQQRVERGLVPSIIFRKPAKGEDGILGRMGVYGVPGLSMAVIKDHQVDWSAGYGVKAAGTSDPITPETLFQTCSVAKIISAMGVLRLAQEGSFGLDDDINDHLKTWKLRAADGWHPSVTIRQLLAHTSGVQAFGSAFYARDAVLPTLDQILDGIPPAINAPIRVVSMPGMCADYA